MTQTSVTNAVSRDISPANARKPEPPQIDVPSVVQVVTVTEATVMVVTTEMVATGTGNDQVVVTETVIMTVVVIVMTVEIEVVIVGRDPVIQMPVVIDVIVMVISPGIVKRLQRDVIDAISQDIWLRIVKMMLRVDHATTVVRPVTYNVTAHRQPPRTATSARMPVIWPVTAQPRSVTIVLNVPMTVMTGHATTVVNPDIFHGTALNQA